MAKKIYLWIEDRKGKSGYTFWENLMRCLCPEVIVESKENNSKMVKAVRNLKDEDNEYILVYDNSFDNMQTVQELKVLQQYTEKKKNVHEFHIICFEYILLEFRKLIEWIYAPEDEFLIKRKKEITAREKLIEIVSQKRQDYKDVTEIREYRASLEDYNIEQLSARLLFDLTRNTGFEVSKGKIGECWIADCCQYSERQENDACGLDDGRISVADKMKEIYNNTSLVTEFQQVGLEVLK